MGDDTFSLVDGAKYYFNQGLFDKALGMYDEALKTNPNDTHVLEEIGQILYTMNNYIKALKINKKLLHIHEELKNFEAKAETFKKTGRIYNLKDEYSNILETYENWLQLQDHEVNSEENIDIFFKFGEFYYKNF